MIELDRTLPFVDAVFRTVDHPHQIDAAARLLNEIESRRHVRLHYMSDVMPDELNDDQWCNNVFFPFLTETQLIISGGDLLNLVEVLRDDGKCEAFTWRGWGYTLAEWANKHWIPRPVGLGTTAWTRKKRRWNYLDFYMREHLSYQIVDHHAYADAVLAIIERKSELFPMGTENTK